jgi:hypothetical protein
MVGWRRGQLGGSVAGLLMVHPMVIKDSRSDHSMEWDKVENAR